MNLLLTLATSHGADADAAGLIDLLLGLLALGALAGAAYFAVHRNIVAVGCLIVVAIVAAALAFSV
jgi:hypothetical protein